MIILDWTSVKTKKKFIDTSFFFKTISILKNEWMKNESSGKEHT